MRKMKLEKDLNLHEERRKEHMQKVQTKAQNELNKVRMIKNKNKENTGYAGGSNDVEMSIETE